MQKIANYITNGKGIGALLLLLFSVIVAFISAYSLHTSLPPIVPHIQQFADEFLPITIEKGKVIVPENTVKKHIYDLGGSPFEIVLDTKKEILEESAKPGIYLTNSYLYLVSDNEVRRKSLTDVQLEKKDYTETMLGFISAVVWMTAIIGPFFNFVFFLIGVLFYAFCTGLSCALNKKTMNFKAKMRLNTILFMAIYALTIILHYAGLNISTLTFFLIMIALQIIIVKKLPE